MSFSLVCVSETEPSVVHMLVLLDLNEAFDAVWTRMWFIDLKEWVYWTIVLSVHYPSLPMACLKVRSLDNFFFPHVSL